MAGPNPGSSFSAVSAASQYPIDNQIDGNISAVFRPRIAAFQRLNDLETTGTLNQETQEAYFKVLAASGVNSTTKIGAAQNQDLKQLQETLAKRVQELRDDDIEQIHAEHKDKRSEKLKDSGLQQSQIDQIEDILDGAAGKQDAQTKIAKILPQDDKKTADSLFETLWILQLEQINQIKNLDGDVSQKLSRDDVKAFAALDILQYAQKGLRNNSLQDMAGPTTKQDYTDDRFFAKEVYEALARQNPIDGKLIDYPGANPGVMIPPEDVAQIAYNKLMADLDEAGIAPQDMTRAIFEGRFNPSFDDLKLVEQAAPRPRLDDLLANDRYTEYLADSIKSGIIQIPQINGQEASYEDINALLSDVKNGKNSNTLNALNKAVDNASFYALEPASSDFRAEFMTSHFGSLSDLNNVKSITHSITKDEKGLNKIEYKETVISADDIGLNMLDRLHNRDFKDTYGITADQARNRLEMGQDLPAALQSGIHKMTQSMSVTSYFKMGEGDEFIGKRNYQADYQALRDQYVSNHIKAAELENKADYNPTDPTYGASLSPTT